MATEDRKTASLSPEERMVIFASSLGTVFEWYDFYLYGTLAKHFAKYFFPPGNDTAALLGSLLAYAVGFLVRPFGAIVFGRIGDLVGRKYTFLVTIVVMGASTFLVGILPSYETIGAAAPAILTLLRIMQGLALGGEYGGAATYVAEHARPTQRGYTTSWIQTTATLGLLLSLVVIGTCQGLMSKEAFAGWGWRIPFVVSLVLLGVSVYIRSKLNESPVFQKMKSENRASKQPLTDSFLRYPNNKYVALALFGATMGQGVVWYTGQFYALFFLQNTLSLDDNTTYLLIGASLVIATPLFVVFGRLSDRIGRLKIILAGCLIAAIAYIPLFKGLTHYVHPALEEFQDKVAISVAADDCNVHIFPTSLTKYTECDSVKDYLTRKGLSFESLPPVAGQVVVAHIGPTELVGWKSPAKGKADPRYEAALKAQGYVAADHARINYPMAIAVLVLLVVFVTMVYGPIAAFLVEMFPANIRYTSMSLPYHIGNGVFGGMLPLIASAWVLASGNVYRGLWYPIIVALVTLVVGGVFLRDAKSDFDINH
jgi:MFS family permease